MWEGTGVLVSKNWKFSFYAHVHKHQVYIRTAEKTSRSTHAKLLSDADWVSRMELLLNQPKSNCCAPRKKVVSALGSCHPRTTWVLNPGKGGPS